MATQRARRLLAELIGTALLVLFGAGSVVAALKVGDGKHDYPGLGMIAFAFGLIIAIVIYGFATTSGAHINPAVSVSLAVVRRFPWREEPAYVVAQVAGAVLGGLLVVAVFGAQATRLGGVGSTTLAEGAGYLRGIVAEVIGTFLLLFAIMALAVDRRAPRLDEPGPHLRPVPREHPVRRLDAVGAARRVRDRSARRRRAGGGRLRPGRPPGPGGAGGGAAGRGGRGPRSPGPRSPGPRSPGPRSGGRAVGEDRTRERR